jgi:hypothetical protein
LRSSTSSSIRSLRCTVIRRRPTKTTRYLVARSTPRCLLTGEGAPDSIVDIMQTLVSLQAGAPFTRQYSRSADLPESRGCRQFDIARRLASTGDFPAADVARPSRNASGHVVADSPGWLPAMQAGGALVIVPGERKSSAARPTNFTPGPPGWPRLGPRRTPPRPHLATSAPRRTPSTA